MSAAPLHPSYARMANDPYSTLDVARGASEAEIKSAYRKLAKQLHPDANKNNPKASERFSDVTRAYDLLSDKGKRAQFDRGEIDADGNPAMPYGFGGGGGPQGGFRGDPRAGGFGGAGGDFSDVFSDLFGGRGGQPFGGQRSAPPKGGNIAYRLAISFIDAATRAPQRITLSDGATIDLKMPAGVEGGTQMRLGGKGQAGPGGTGDAIVTIDIKDHPHFIRDGANIRLDLVISLKEAVLGAKVKVPTVDGPVMLSVPPGATSGRVMRLKGKGWSIKGDGRGDQYVRLMIDLPADDTALQAFAQGWDDPHDPRAGFYD